jgi:hypothetical protein
VSGKITTHIKKAPDGAFFILVTTFQNPCAHRIVCGDFVFWIIITIHHQMARFGQQAMTIAA